MCNESLIEPQGLIVRRKNENALKFATLQGVRVFRHNSFEILPRYPAGVKPRARLFSKFDPPEPQPLLGRRIVVGERL